MSNTSHIDFSRCLLLPQDAAVLPNILGLDVFDVHFGCPPLQCHLISSPVIELVLRLPPLHRHPSPGQLTAKGHIASFRGLLVLQTHFKVSSRLRSAIFISTCRSFFLIWYLSPFFSSSPPFLHSTEGAGFRITLPFLHSTGAPGLESSQQNTALSPSFTTRFSQLTFDSKLSSGTTLASYKEHGARHGAFCGGRIRQSSLYHRPSKSTWLTSHRKFTG
ncbi:hypothetical protein FQN60_012963 [Etheostoma spectabile]|uniref:Uncharacterized protein n=1 Tax=Etheostoma spectabile TaxID=54343 RepID=A0A5J5D4H5_9PERO|nr:hypothetical protein FQN60_012963 [Etheostoma spectabile]